MELIKRRREVLVRICCWEMEVASNYEQINAVAFYLSLEEMDLRDRLEELNSRRSFTSGLTQGL